MPTPLEPAHAGAGAASAPSAALRAATGDVPLALHRVAGHDLQQLSLMWLAEPATAALLAEILADAAAGKDVYAPYLARAAAAAAAASAHVGGGAAAGSAFSPHPGLGNVVPSPGARVGGPLSSGGSSSGSAGSGSSYGFGRIVLSGSSPQMHRSTSGGAGGAATAGSGGSPGPSTPVAGASATGPAGPREPAGPPPIASPGASPGTAAATAAAAAAAAAASALSPGGRSQSPSSAGSSLSSPPGGAYTSYTAGTQRSTPPMSPHHSNSNGGAAAGFTVSPSGSAGRVPPLSPTRRALAAAAGGGSAGSPGPGSPRHFTFAAGGSPSAAAAAAAAGASGSSPGRSPRAGADDAFPFTGVAAASPTAAVVPALSALPPSPSVAAADAGGAVTITTSPRGAAGMLVGGPLLVLPSAGGTAVGSPPQSERSAEGALRDDRSPLSPTASAGGIALAAVAAAQHAQAAAAAIAAANAAMATSAAVQRQTSSSGSGAAARPLSGEEPGAAGAALALPAVSPTQQQQHHLAPFDTSGFLPTATGASPSLAGPEVAREARFSSSPQPVGGAASATQQQQQQLQQAQALDVTAASVASTVSISGRKNLDEELKAAGGGAAGADDGGASLPAPSTAATAAAAARAAALGASRRSRVDGHGSDGAVAAALHDDEGADDELVITTSPTSGSGATAARHTGPLRLTGRVPGAATAGSAPASATASPVASPRLVAAAIAEASDAAGGDDDDDDALSVDSSAAHAAPAAAAPAASLYTSPYLNALMGTPASGTDARPTISIEPLALPGGAAAAAAAAAASTGAAATAAPAASGSAPAAAAGVGAGITLGDGVSLASAGSSAVATPRAADAPASAAAAPPSPPAVAPTAAAVVDKDASEVTVPASAASSSSAPAAVSIPTFWSKDKGYRRVSPKESGGNGGAATSQPAATQPAKIAPFAARPGSLRPPGAPAASTGPGGGGGMPGETLPEKLPAILDLFRRGSAAAAAAATTAGLAGQAATPPPVTPPQPQVYRAGPDGTLTAVPGARVGVSIAGVTVSWADAHTALPVEQFAAVAKTLCCFPSFFAAPLFRRVRAQFCSAGPGSCLPSLAAPTPAVNGPSGTGLRATSEAGSSEEYAAVIALSAREAAPSADDPSDRDVSGTIPLGAFLAYWAAEMAPHDHAGRFFRLVKRRDDPAGIRPGDFMPLLEELLAFHPGLAFLENTPEFQEKYARTVTARIFYVLDVGGRRVIDLRSLRKSNLLTAFHAVDVEEDINQVTEYFSYEHFYVLYCKFWELDSDHDFLLSRQDLNRLSDVTHVLLDRVFAQAGRPFSSGRPDRMAYEDFVCFYMSEEDKTNEASLRYWFGVADVDGDGVLSASDLRYFYREQEQRMRSYGMEVISFADLLCQMTDLLRPQAPAGGPLAPPSPFPLPSADGRVGRGSSRHGGLTIEHFLAPDRIRIAGVLFSALWNLGKLQAFESRDPWTWKAEFNAPPHPTAWARFAANEYVRLASEEEEAANAAGQGGGTAAVAAAAAASPATAASMDAVSLALGGGVGDLDGLGGSGGSGLLDSSEAFENVFSAASASTAGNKGGGGNKGKGAGGGGGKGGKR